MFYTRIISTLFTASLLFAYGCASHSGDDHDHDHEGDRKAESAEHGSEPDSPDGEISIAPERAQQLGIATTTARVDNISEVIKTSGEVLFDPHSTAYLVAPAAGQIIFNSNLDEGRHIGKGQSVATISTTSIAGGDAIKAARLQYEAAKREVERLKPLREEGIVTVGEYNAAVAAMELAQNATSSSNRSVTSPLSGTITSVDVANGQYVEAGTQIATVATENGHMIVRADLPKRYVNLAKSISSARISEPYTGEVFDAAITTSPVTATSSAGYIPLYFAISESSNLAPSSYVDVYISTASERRGISLPIEAISDKLGKKFVYIKLDEDCYERRPVEVGTVNANLVEIISGVNDGEEVVTSGATFVRLAENSNVAVPGHTHNH